MIEAYRKAEGWSREEFEWQSHLAGIGTTTLTNVETGKPVYAFTLKIVAETLGVPVRSLIAEDEFGPEAEPVDISTTNVANDGIARLIQIDRSPKTAEELATILRTLLDRICP